MRVLWITAVAVVLDQLTKFMVLRTMYRSQSIPLIGDWLKLTFTENPGMAFGITFGPKMLITIFSVIASVLIAAYLYAIRDAYWPYRASLALILGGAFGNIIDRVFYGVLLGYETLFAGRVVDFIHVDLWSGYINPAVPFFGGSYLALFPIWNVADMAIVGGVIGILIFQHRYHEELTAGAPAAWDEASQVDPAKNEEAYGTAAPGRLADEEGTLAGEDAPPERRDQL